MAQKSNTDDQFLRHAFDTAYTITWDDIKRLGKRFDRRTIWLLVSLVASLVLLLVMFRLTQVGVSAVQWVNRPSIEQRLLAPYEKEERLIPLVNTSRQTVLPATLKGFTREYNAVPSLLETCLLGARDQSNNCLSVQARHVESGLYQNSEGQQVGVAIAQFKSKQDAAQALKEMYRYSRGIGRVGNYALATDRGIDYYYSSTRQNFSFSWSNGNWVFSINAAAFTALEEFVWVFPH